MNSNNEKRLCWNCDGAVPHHLAQCPYCGADLNRPASPQNEGQVPFQGFASPFQSAPNQQEIPKPPYAGFTTNEYAVTEDEWNHSIEKEGERRNEEEDLAQASKRDMIALLLLLPGVVFFLFGLILTLFSSDGVLSLEWSQHLAYFYFLGAAPLFYLGYRALR